MNPTRMTLLATTLIAAPAWSQDTSVQPEATAAITEQVSVTASDFMVASANPLATEAGAEILRAGGSAADAAVAVQMMLNLVEPQSSGIGGGAFALYWNDALGTLTTFDGRETAPAAATPDYWIGADGEPVGFWDAVRGGRSAGVPGTLKLMERIHADYGRLPWSVLFQPAIDLAEAGFPVSLRLAA
jgi:gamma-glutamyltranspeptidase/glutathione hydrolase